MENNINEKYVGKLIMFDSLNSNGRIYSSDMISEFTNQLKMYIDIDGFGELKPTSDHIDVNVANISHRTTNFVINLDKSIDVEIEVLDTPNGKILQHMLDSHIQVYPVIRGTTQGGVDENGIIHDFNLNAIDIAVSSSFGENCAIKPGSISDWSITINPETNLPNGVDKECVALCVALNKLDSVQTTESCCGHLNNQYMIFFNCSSFKTLAILYRCVNRNYSDGKFELLVDGSDTCPCNQFLLRSKEPFKSYDEMNKSVERLIENIKHWTKPEFDDYFSGTKS